MVHYSQKTIELKGELRFGNENIFIPATKKAYLKVFYFLPLETPKTNLKIRKLSSKMWQYHVSVGVNVLLSSIPNNNIFAPQNYHAARYLFKD